MFSYVDFASTPSYGDHVLLRNQIPAKQRKRLEKRFYLAWEVSVFIYSKIRKDYPDWPNFEFADDKLTSLGLVGFALRDFGSFLACTNEYAGLPDDHAKMNAVNAYVLLGKLVQAGPHKKIAKILEL